jgi:hypothetical protein
MKAAEEKRTFKDWYEDNKDDLSKRRKKAYRGDPKKRKDAQARARATREKRKAGVPVERVLYREHGGKQVPVYSTGYIASKLGCSPTMILNWEKRTWLPEPIFDEAHRLYLSHQVKLIEKLYEAVQSGKAKRITTALEKVHDDW